MKNKTIVLILLLMLVIPTTLSSAKNIEAEKGAGTLDDVPIWNNGDTWTYSVEDFWVNYSYQGRNIQMQGSIDNFEWKVSNTAGSSYVVDISGDIDGTYAIKLPIGSISLNLEGIIDPSSIKLSGSISFSKDLLEIERFNAVISGFSKIGFKAIPIKFTIPLRMSADGTITPKLKIMNFPLSTLKIWALPATSIVTDVNIGGILGIFKIPITFTTNYNYIPFAFTCLYKTSTTVPAGTYDAWRIQSLLGGFFEYCYAPDVKNLIKYDIQMFNGGITGELIDTNQ